VRVRQIAVGDDEDGQLVALGQVEGEPRELEIVRGEQRQAADLVDQVAQDGEGANSTYTTALLKVLAEPGLPVESVFKRVRSEVSRMTGDTQIPWEASSLTGDFFFAGASSPPKSAPTAGADSEAELLFWQSVKDSPDAGDFEAYLRQYPNGRFSEIARNRLNRLKSAK